MKINIMRSTTARSEQAPGWVDAILDWRWTWPIIRLALTSLFLMAAAVEISDFRGAAAGQEHFGLRPGWLWVIVTIVVQLTGSAIILSGRYVWLGAGMLGVFTAATEIIAHRFWELSGAALFAHRNEFFEHLGLIAGLVMVARLARRDERL
ncbi:MAG: DoxX family protein [Caulobacteraceae bacterium]|nr:DoxX family protein [Caulobacteraceae bacterium]